MHMPITVSMISHIVKTCYKLKNKNQTLLYLVAGSSPGGSWDTCIFPCKCLPKHCNVVVGCWYCMSSQEKVSSCRGSWADKAYCWVQGQYRMYFTLLWRIFYYWNKKNLRCDWHWLLLFSFVLGFPDPNQRPFAFCQTHFIHWTTRLKLNQHWLTTFNKNWLQAAQNQALIQQELALGKIPIVI